jgi:hypothetical protein
VRFVPRIEAGAMMPCAVAGFNNLEWQSAASDLAAALCGLNSVSADKGLHRRLF